VALLAALIAHEMHAALAAGSATAPRAIDVTAAMAQALQPAFAAAAAAVALAWGVSRWLPPLQAVAPHGAGPAPVSAPSPLVK
jgi:hypothetical protein